MAGEGGGAAARTAVVFGGDNMPDNSMCFPSSPPPCRDLTAWVPVEHITDLSGPTFFYQRAADDENSTGAAPQHMCVALNSTLNRVEAQLIEGGSALSLDDAQVRSLDVDGAEIVFGGQGAGTSEVAPPPEPADVMQVWVATRVLDTPSTSPRYTFRSAEAKFLTAERSGTVSAFTEARGPLEEWSLAAIAQRSRASENTAPETTRQAFALRGASGHLLGIDVVAGGRRVLRCDVPVEDDTTSSVAGAEAATPSNSPSGAPPSAVKAASNVVSADESAHWHVLVQWKFRHEARRREQGDAPLRARDAAFYKKAR